MSILLRLKTEHNTTERYWILAHQESTATHARTPDDDLVRLELLFDLFATDVDNGLGLSAFGRAAHGPNDPGGTAHCRYRCPQSGDSSLGGHCNHHSSSSRRKGARCRWQHDSDSKSSERASHPKVGGSHGQKYKIQSKLGWLSGWVDNVATKPATALRSRQSSSAERSARSANNQR